MEKMDFSGERQLSIQDYIRIIYRGRWIILISFVTVLFFVSYYTFTATPIYRSTVKVMVKDNGGVQKTLFNVVDYMEKEKKINNEVEILKSRILAENVVQELYNSDKADQLIILGNASPKKSKGFGFFRAIKSFLSALFSENNKNTLPTADSENLKHQRIVSSLQGRIVIEPVRNTDMIDISLTAESPEEAAFLANTVARVYQEQNQSESREEVRKVKDFLQNQLNMFQAQLHKSEQALKDYQEKKKVIALPKEVEEMVTKLAEFESMFHGVEIELNSNKERLAYIDKQLEQNRQYINMDNILKAPLLDELSQQMAELQTKRAKYIAALMDEGVYDPANPDSKLRQFDEQEKVIREKYKSEITQLASVETVDPLAMSQNLLQRKLEIEATIQSLLPKIKTLKSIVDDYNADLEKVPQRSLELARLERAAKLDEKITLMMKEKYEESRITEVGQLGNVRIIDPARANYIPISPKKKMNLILGIIVGLGLGFGITFLLEYFDNSVKSPDEIERMGLSILGTIPVIQLDEAMRKVNQNGDNGFTRNGNFSEARVIAGRLITHFAPKSPIAEAYRSLRTSIQFSRADKPLKTIVFTSAEPKEGKSTTVVNLAIAIAQLGSRVLLVDSDLRRPVIHSIFDLDRSRGLSNFLIGKISLDEAIFESDVDNLNIMPSGTLPPNPSELLGSVAMKNCIAELKNRFDVVLFDSPPVLAVTDAVILSSEVDGVVVVIKEGQTNREAVKRCYGILQKIPNRLLGAVLNGIHVNGFHGYGYYYYYHYNYYGKEQKQKKKNMLKKDY
ncbi:MAG: polysaccharide biosynthesis tyrosine autokinase [Calditrichaeota bacterium]|nr:polysaccharide biosynthesis tyrosine autokinase [Calditrichota bacterium]